MVSEVRPTDSAAPAVRLCHLRFWPNFDGYGFNLHAKQGNVGHFIGQVDERSPAEAAGLRKGDYIVEVNERDVTSESHPAVVQTIKAHSDRVSLLVVSEEGLQYYRSKGIELHAKMAGVIVGHSDIAHSEVNSVAGLEATSSQVDPVLRQCHVYLQPHFSGFGFNLHSDKQRKFLGSVDEGSPASMAGLQVHDRLLEVNGESVEHLSHKEVIEIIKSKPDSVEMLVADEASFQYYRARDIQPNSHMPSVLVLGLRSHEEEEEEAASHREEEKEESQHEEQRVHSDAGSHHSSEHVAPSEPPAAVHVDTVPTIPSDAPDIRVCVMKRWSSFVGYGFNLHAEKGKQGHFIGIVDDNSPAETAKLLRGDKIMAVNGDSILECNHQEVVSKIKADPGQVRLLVLDPEAVEYYNSRAIAVHEDMPDVIRTVSPDTQPEAHVNGQVTHVEVNHSSEEERVHAKEDEEEERQSRHSRHSSSGRSTPVHSPVVHSVDPEQENKVQIESDHEEMEVRAQEPSSEVLEHQRDPSPVRDPSPEPRREDSPEPVRDPSPEPRREESPEPIREPSPEPKRESIVERDPSPEPAARDPSPVQSSPKPKKKKVPTATLR